MSEAQSVVAALGGEWRNSTGLAPCPICQAEGRKDQRGLAVKDAAGRTLMTCHKSGCPASDIFTELRARGILAGRGEISQRSSDDIEKDRAKRKVQRLKMLRYCSDIFDQAKPITGTPAETYLARRGIPIQGHKVRNTLRYHKGLRHPGTGEDHPAMVARLRGPKGEPLGLHRTYLRPDGSGKADVKGGSKFMLGPCGGGAVRFGPDRPVIAIAEGIETALSISAASRMTTWATLSTSGMKGLILPPQPIAGVVVIAADNDPPGLAAAEETAARFEAEGRAVSVIAPQVSGADFNDVLQGVSRA